MSAEDKAMIDPTVPTYIVYDGRAMAGNTDDAMIMEIFHTDAFDENDNAAMAEARLSWSDQGAVLYKAYPDPKNPNALINQELVGMIDDYRAFPGKKRKRYR